MGSDGQRVRALQPLVSSDSPAQAVEAAKKKLLCWKSAALGKGEQEPVLGQARVLRGSLFLTAPGTFAHPSGCVSAAW